MTMMRIIIHTRTAPPTEIPTTTSTLLKTGVIGITEFVEEASPIPVVEGEIITPVVPVVAGAEKNKYEL
jgi:hypothetical protein